MSAKSGNDTGTMIANAFLIKGYSDLMRNRDKIADKDILVVATLAAKDILSEIFTDSAFTFNGYELNIYDYGIFSLKGGVLRGIERLLSGDFRNDNADANRYVRTSLAWRGFLSLISPYDSERIAVVVTATEDREIEKLSDDLDKPGVKSKIGGDITIIDGIDRVMKYNVGDYIFTGDVSPLFEIMYFAGEHIMWLAIFSVLLIMILSLIITRILQKRARRRLNEGQNGFKY